MARRTLSLIGASTLIFAPVGYAAEIIPITSFDPTTFFEGVTAGFDFDGVGGPTQSGFTSIAPGGTGTTTYNAVSNGITLDLTNPLFPRLRSGQPLFQRPSPQKQIPSINSCLGNKRDLSLSI